jgi:ferredoxin-nitrate reductase
MRHHDDHRATSGEAICPYCGVGCRLWMEAAYGQVLRVKGCAAAPANRGGICAKGATLPQVLHTPDRLIQPHLRTASGLRPVSWDRALETVATQLAEICRRHGPGAIALYGSGQLDTESVYVAVKLFKGALGTNHTDSNSRLCMAAAVAGHRSSLGSDGPPTCYDDLDEADLLLVIGSNMAEAHPVLWDRIRQRRRQADPPALVVIDPRRTPTAAAADEHLPVAPGGDIALCNALAQRLWALGSVDEAFVREHTSGFDAYVAMLQAQDPRELEAACGVPPEQLDRLAARIAKARAWLSLYCMGLGQSTVGMWKHNALINLHLMTGQIARVGAGPFSLTGQPNAMGGREAGLLAHQLPGYRLIENPDDRRQVETLWGLPPGHISPQPGLTAIEMFRALETGRLKAIWIAATNPLVSLPDLHQVRRALARAELVIVQDAYHPTETTQLAHVLLPAATWAEKEWTSTNSERMVSLSERLLPPPGSARPDWEIFAAVARKMGLAGFDFAHRDEVWDEFIRLTTGRECDMTGITAQRLRREKNLQWPCPDVAHPGTKRRYLDRRFPTPDGRARFWPRTHRPPRELPDHEFPLVLTTGRIYAHWHTLTRTGKSPKLVQRDPGPYVEIHPDDALPRQIVDGALVQLTSRRGTIRLPARLTTAIRPGTVFVPLHWGDLWSDGNAINYLTISATGRVAKQPELKFCAVQLELAPVAGNAPPLAPAEAVQPPVAPTSPDGLPASVAARLAWR